MSSLARPQDGSGISFLRLASLQVLKLRRAALALNSTSQSESRSQDALRPGAASDQAAGATDTLPPVSADVMADSEAVSDAADASPMILSPLHSGDSAESETQKDPDARKLAEKARDDLKNAMMIRCEFKPGATGYWQNQNLSVSLFDWQGGPVTFEVVDLSAGTARMLGGVGATGSQDGVIDVMVAAIGHRASLFSVHANSRTGGGHSVREPGPLRKIPGGDVQARNADVLRKHFRAELRQL